MAEKKEVQQAARVAKKILPTLDWSKGEDIEDLKAIGEAVTAATVDEKQLRELVNNARNKDRKWEEIALALGLSRQEARRRFGTYKYERYEFMAEFDLDEKDIDNTSKRIGARIQGWSLGQIRQNAGFTQAQLAQVMGITQSRISAIENDALEALTLATIRSYIEALGGKLYLVSNIEALNGAFHLAVDTNRVSTDSEENND